MCRLILLLCVLGLLSGCGKKSPTGAGLKKEEDGNKKDTVGDAGGKKRILKEGSESARTVEDYIADSYKGEDYDILSTREQQTTFRKMPAVVVYLQWKLKGKGEQQNVLMLVQDKRVKYTEAFDTTKSFEENVKVFVKQMEAP